MAGGEYFSFAGDPSVSYNTYTAPSATFGEGSILTSNMMFEYTERIRKLEEKIQQMEKDAASAQYNSTINKGGTAILWWELRAMLNNMRDHIKYYRNNGGEIMFAQNPKELRYEFICGGTGNIWAITMSNIKVTSQEMYVSDGRGVLIPDAFKTQEGIDQLLNVINGR